MKLFGLLLACIIASSGASTTGGTTVDETSPAQEQTTNGSTDPADLTTSDPLGTSSEAVPTDSPSVSTEEATDAPSVSTEDATDSPSVSTEDATDAPSVSTEEATDSPSVSTEVATDAPSVSTEDATDAPSVSTEDATDAPSVSTEEATDAPSVSTETDSSNMPTETSPPAVSTDKATSETDGTYKPVTTDSTGDITTAETTTTGKTTATTTITTPIPSFPPKIPPAIDDQTIDFELQVQFAAPYDNNLTDPSHPYYKQLQNDTYTELWSVYNTDENTELGFEDLTVDGFIASAEILERVGTFEDGSEVIAVYTLVYSASVIVDNPDTVVDNITKYIKDSAFPKLTSIGGYNVSQEFLEDTATDLLTNRANAIKKNPCEQLVSPCYFGYKCLAESSVECVFKCSDEADEIDCDDLPNSACFIDDKGEPACKCLPSHLYFPSKCVPEALVIGVSAGVGGAILVALIVAVIVLAVQKNKAQSAAADASAGQRYKMDNDDYLSSLYKSVGAEPESPTTPDDERFKTGDVSTFGRTQNTSVAHVTETADKRQSGASSGQSSSDNKNDDTASRQDIAGPADRGSSSTADRKDTTTSDLAFDNKAFVNDVDKAEDDVDKASRASLPPSRDPTLTDLTAADTPNPTPNGVLRPYEGKPTDYFDAKELEREYIDFKPNLGGVDPKAVYFTKPTVNLRQSISSDRNSEYYNNYTYEM